MTPKFAFCEQHGLSYDTDRHAACPECLLDADAEPDEGRPSQLDTAQPPPRPSQMETQRPLEAGSTGSLRAPSTTRRFASQLPGGTPTGSFREGSTTRRFGTRSSALGRRPSQLETQRPRVPPAVVRAAPLDPRPRGWLTLGVCSLLALLIYRQWPRGAPETASPERGAAAGVRPAAAAPVASRTAHRDPASPFAAPGGENGSGAPAGRALPAIRYRARRGEVPEICRVPWRDMYERERAETAQGRGAAEPTPLMRAAESGSLEELQELVSSGAALDARDELNHTALTYAARRGRSAHVELLLRAGADARTRGTWDAAGGSMSALDAALREGAISTAQLIEREVLQGFLYLEGPDLSAIDEAGDTPLHWVARYADARAAQLLIERGADPEIQNCPARPGDERGLHRDDVRSATALLVAVWAGNPAVVRLLLEANANARAVDERGRGAFHLMRHPESLALTEDLLRAGADPLLRDSEGKTPADALAANGLRADFTRALAAAGRPIPSTPATLEDLFGTIARLGGGRGNAPPPPGAAERDDPAPVLALLESDSLLVSATDAEGRTALFEAAFQGLPRVARALVARGARVDARDRGGRSALHRAEDATTIAVLVSLGVDVNARDPSGTTPLHLRAAMRGSLAAVTALVDAGADTRLQDSRGRRALDLARESGSEDVIEYLENQR